MSLLSISEAAHVAGVSRRTIQRSVQSGRLSAATTATGERAIDTAELLRVFGTLRHAPSDMSAPMSQADAATQALVDVLREQLRKAEEREQQAQQERLRLLSLLETEQQARRDLEQKLLPAPTPQPALHHHHRLWVLLLVLVAAVAALVWSRGGG